MERYYHEGDEAEASSPSSSSSPPVREDGFQYDVFLSFRGPDTRNHFTGHLYYALEDKGIVTFIDSEKLEKGEKVGELLECIQRSKIFVPIFSKGYAKSKWCLREIAKIVECKRLIIPVFYGVEPTHVRHQTGPFTTAFREYHRKKGMDKEEVRTWSAALTEVGNVSGYNLADTEGNESKLIPLIVKRILREVNKMSLFVAKHPVGLDSHIANVMEMLDTEAQGKMVGIHGIGGMGKTTLAKAVYNQIYTLFDAYSFIPNVREAAKQSTGLVSLQEQLLCDVLKEENVKVRSTSHGIEIIRQRIRSKKVLLVLDDVDDKSQLDALAGGEDWFCSGSRIIMTSRNKQVLRAQRVLNLYEVKGLDDNQSLQLFSWHAFGKEEPNVKFEKLSTEVAATAAGLPLALEIFGSHFFDLQTIDEWRDKLEQLRKDQNKHIHEKLKISYDVLDEEEKIVFLDIACFFIGKERKLATIMWEDCKFFPSITIKVLVHKSLVNINDDTGEFEMHDHIRDMGRKIVQDESLSNPEMCSSRLWKDADETLDVLQNKREMKNVEAIQLKCLRFMSVSEEFFTTMSQLRMLRLWGGVRLEGEHEHFPSKLRWLEWHPDDLDSLPDGLYLENIVVLDLSFSSITQLWNPQTYARIKAFGKLKVLNLKFCYYLTSCPDFKRMPHLEKLNLEGCGELSDLHPSIGHLKWLTHLSLGYNDSLKELPPEVWQLPSLEEFDLGNCSEITSLPPQKQLLLDKLKLLNLRDCRKLRICPEFTSMPHLETLSFEGCRMMGELHPSIGCLKSLTHLSLRCCYSLKELPPEVWQLTSLQEFDLSGCYEITVLPPQEQLLLDQLKVLDLTKCRKLRICPEFTSMPHLERLEFEGCEEMSELHPSIGCLKSLTHLSLGGCPSQKELPEQIWQLISLEILVLSECYEITTRPSHLGDSEYKLKALRLYGCNCKDITKSPDFMSMPHIKILDFSGCEKMSELHPSIGHLKGLTELNLSGCKSLKELPPEIWQLTSLELFNLSNCSQITALPSQLGDSKSLGKLKVLKLAGCENLTTTCLDFMSMLKCLTVLDLSDSISLKEIPKCIVSLDMLERLTVAGCEQLKFLPQLPPSLTILDASGCRQLEIIENVSNLERLNALCLHDCERLVDVPGIEKMKCLMNLELGGCRSICNSLWEKIQEANFNNLYGFSIPGSPIKSEALCKQSLSFLLPKQVMCWLDIFKNLSALSIPGSPIKSEASCKQSLSFLLPNQFMANEFALYLYVDQSRLRGRVVRIDITVEDAQYPFSTLVKKHNVATFGWDSNLMMKAREGGFAGYHSNAAQRKTWMMMRVSIDGCILLHGDLFTPISLLGIDVNKVCHNLVVVEFGK